MQSTTPTIETSDEHAIRMLAKAIALGVYNNAEDDAAKQIKRVFDMGRLEGKAEAYRAERRELEAAAERRRQPKRTERLNG